MSKDKVSIDSYEYWALRSSHERLAVKSGDVKEIVLCAQERMRRISTGLTASNRPDQLCYKGDEEHMYAAYRLLNEARKSQLRINKCDQYLKDSK